jgi:hypothetical protein
MREIAIGSTPVWMPAGRSFMSHVGLIPCADDWMFEIEPNIPEAKIWSVNPQQVVAYYTSQYNKSVVVDWSEQIPGIVVNGVNVQMKNFYANCVNGLPTVNVLFDLNEPVCTDEVLQEWDAWCLDDIAIHMRVMLKDIALIAQMGMIDVSMFSTGPLVSEICNVLNGIWEYLSLLNVESEVVRRVYGVISFLLHLAAGGMNEVNYIHHLLDLFVLCGWETTTVAILVQKVLGMQGSLLRSQNPQVVAQMTGDYSPIVSLIFCIMSMLYFKVLPNQNDSKSFMRSFGDFGNAARAVTGCDGAIKVCVKAFKCAYEWFEEKITGVTSGMKELLNVDESLSPWISRVYELYDEFKSTGHVLDETKRALCQELLEKGRKFKRDLSMLKLPPTLWNTFLEVFMKAEKMDAYRAQSEFLDSPRVPPLVIWLYGETSVGKSTLVNFLCVDLLTKSGQCTDPDKVFKHIFCRNVETDFWDGYNPNHKVVIYDDFSAKIPGNDKCSQVGEIIQCSNIMPFPLHVAELEEKKSARFRSELVFITSNLADPDLREMNNPEAVLRRRDFVVRVKAKPEFVKMSHKYGTGRVPSAILDKEKIRRVFGTEKLLHTDIYLFQLENNMNHDPMSAWISYEELCEILLDAYVQNVRQGTRYIDEMKVRARENILAQMGEYERVSCERQLIVRFQSPFTRIQALGFLSQVDALLDEDGETSNSTKLRRMKGILMSSLAMTDGLPSDVLNLECVKCQAASFVTRSWHKLKQWYNNETCPHQTIGTCDDLINGVKSYANKTLSFVKRNATSIVVGAVVGSLSVWMLTRSDKKELEVTPVERIVEAQSMYERDGPRMTKVISKRFKTRSRRLNAEYGKNIEDALSKLLKKNQFLVTCERTNKSVNALFLVGKTCLLPLHFLEHLENGEKVVFSNKEVGIFAEMFDENNVCAMEETDIAVYSIASRLLPSRPDVRMLFVLESELTKTRRGEFVLQHLGINTTRIQARGLALEEIFDPEDQPLTYHVPGGAKDIKLVKGHVYFATTREGQCGSPVICANEGINGCIVGIHVAGTAGGTNDMGFSALVTREVVYELCNITSELEAPDVTIPLSEVCTPRCQMGEVPYEHIGVLNQSWMMTGMVKTMLRESPIHDMVTVHKTAPARLKPLMVNGKRISPMVEGLTGAFDENTPMDNSLLTECTRCVAEMIATHIKDEDLSMLTESEAINGIPGMEFIDALNMGSSPGFPLSKLSPGSGKRHLFEGELPNAQVGNGLLRTELNKIDSALDKRRIPEVYFVCTLKDERRSLEKVAAGKTRVFAASNVAHVIRFRQYFLRFAAAFMKHRRQLEHAIGIDVYSLEWEMLLSSMRIHGSKWMALDFKSFDKTISSQMMWSVFSVVRQVYEILGLECSYKMEALFACVAEPRYIIYNDVWQMNRTHPSGEPMTAILNSILVSVLYRYCFTQVARREDPLMASPEQMKRCVSLCSYGDDNIATVHPKVSWFNQLSLAEEMARIGMKMTPAQKNAVMGIYEDQGNVTFLQRKWQWSEKHGVHVPLRDVDDIVEMVNWVRTGNDPVEQVCLNVDDALYELHFHGVQVYNYWRNKFDVALSIVGIKHMALSYAEQLRVWNVRYRV